MTRGNQGGSSSSQDPMLQILQNVIADREASRAERQANLATLQQIAQMALNNQGHGNQDHHDLNSKTFRTPIPQSSTNLKTH